MTLKSRQKGRRKTKISQALRLYHQLNSYKQVWVIADIHSCYYTLKKLTAQFSGLSHTLYIFLGDYINKGDYPQETVDFLMRFSQKNECIFLRGNHDQMLLDAWQRKEQVYVDQIYRLGSGILIDQVAQYESFFSSTFHYVESESYLLVHAGFDFDLHDPFADTERMMMIREINYHRKKAGNRRLIRGHYPQPIEQIRMDIKKEENVISLDNGCVYTERQGMGSLLALELHSWHLIEQRNID